MRVTCELDGSAAYVYLVDRIEPGEAVRQVMALDNDVVIDLDREGRILGIEILNVALLRPETLKIAVPPGQR
jgi:uncharacterized protein YuzE